MIFISSGCSRSDLLYPSLTFQILIMVFAPTSMGTKPQAWVSIPQTTFVRELLYNTQS